MNETITPAQQSPQSFENQSLSKSDTGPQKSSSKESLKHTKPEQKLSIQSSKSNLYYKEKENVTLKEDVFGRYFDQLGEEHLVYRYTWKNANKIQVQVINYGARVTSIKLPDRKGEIEDVVLGFDDIAGYLVYDKHYLGATIGRYSDIIQSGVFRIEKKMYNVSSNYGEHCYNGGFNGLDKAIWNTYINGKKVIMSHVSPNMSEGFPGDLLVRVTFQLSSKNEFNISMDAQSTCPTIVNLSNLLYFNLAGHHKGPEEIYRHVLTMNCNCFTPTDKIGIPTSEIVNVMHTPFDFQIPKQLGKVMGIVPKDGFHQNLCVNRGVCQEDCFVGRLLHIPSGRMLEVYSNQPGVQLLTANDFGLGHIKTPEESVFIKNEPKVVETVVDPIMLVYNKVHEKVLNILNKDKKTNYDEIKNLLIKLCNLHNAKTDSLPDYLNNGLELSPTQMEYLQKAQEIVCENDETDDPCLDLKEALSHILKAVKIVESNKEFGIEYKNEDNNEPISQVKNSVNESTHLRISDVLLLKPNSNKNVTSQNKIPLLYTNPSVIRGKGGAVYKMHGSVALRTQNYPNAANLKNFPNCELKPGEVYKHDIVYRFWIKAGTPDRWMKRNQAAKKPI